MIEEKKKKLSQFKLPLIRSVSQKRSVQLKAFFTRHTLKSETKQKYITDSNNEENSYYYDKSLIKKQRTIKPIQKPFIKDIFLSQKSVTSEKDISQTDSDEINEDSSEKSQSSIDVYDLEKHKEHVRLRLDSKNDSYFGFIKHQNKLRDIAQKFLDEDDMNPMYYFCLHDELFPKRLDLSNCLIDKKEMNFTNLGIDSKYYPILKTLLKQQKSQRIKQLDLSNNNLKDRELQSIINVIPLSLKEIKLQMNKISKNGAIILEQLIQTHLCLKYINLSNNLLGDSGVNIILTSLLKNNVVTRLNLSENGITDSVGKLFETFINSNKVLEVLVLNWNYLGSSSGQYIAQGLLNNKSLKVIDLSYNHLGQHNYCMNYLCEVIQQSKSNLIHIDLSYNQFSKSAIIKLSEALKLNTKIYGIHIEGNKCSAYVDPNGFIQFSDLQMVEKQMRVQQKKYQIDGVNFIPELYEGLQGNDCCWICQGWMEFKFIFTPNEYIGKTPIFLHLDFLGYQPIPMTSSLELREELNKQRKNKQQEQQELTTGEIIHQLKQVINQDKKITMAAIQEAYDLEKKDENLTTENYIDDLDKFYYTTFQMCPPKRRILYFFSNPLTEEYFIDQNSLNIQSPQDDLILQGKDTNHQFHIFTDGTMVKFKKVENVNYLLSKQEYVIDDKNDYKPLVRIFPRSEQKKYILQKFANNLIKKKFNFIYWNKEDSSFKHFIGDTEEFTDICFEFDWQSSKINRFVRNEYEKIKMKEYFRTQYQLLKDLYKYYSSFGYQLPQYELFCIHFPQFHKIAQQVGLVDGNDLKSQDIDSDLISIKNNVEPKYIYNPDQALIRYQFIEILYRLSLDKYVRTGIVKNPADAVYRLLKEFKPYYENFDSIQGWREQRLWNKECDYLIKFKMPFLKKLYDYITDITNRRWYFKLKWISIKEFKEFYKIIGINEYITDKTLIVIYNFSMMTQVDELTQDRNIRMNIDEFIESTARLAERISPAPLGERNNEWTYQQRTTLPLHVKLESFLTYIFNKINKKGQFDLYHDLFYEDIPHKGNSMPFSELSNLDEEYQNGLLTLTVYNTLNYLKQYQKSYLHPKYQIFLQNSVPDQPRFHGPLLNRRYSRLEKKKEK